MYKLEIKLTTEHSNVVIESIIEVTEGTSEVEAINLYLEALPEWIRAQLEDITITTRRLA